MIIIGIVIMDQVLINTLTVAVFITSMRWPDNNIDVVYLHSVIANPKNIRLYTYHVLIVLFR